MGMWVTGGETAERSRSCLCCAPSKTYVTEGYYRGLSLAAVIACFKLCVSRLLRKQVSATSEMPPLCLFLCNVNLWEIGQGWVGVAVSQLHSDGIM